MSGRECTRHAAELIDSALAHMQKQCAGPTVPANCRRSGEIRFEQAAKLEFVIDKKAAKALGITVSQALLLWSDEVIEWGTQQVLQCEGRCKLPVMFGRFWPSSEVTE
jgi:hypothetical protein